MRGIKIDHYTNRILIRFELKVVCINKYLKKCSIACSNMRSGSFIINKFYGNVQQRQQ